MFGHGLDVQNSKSVAPAGLSPLEGELVPAVEGRRAFTELGSGF